MNLKPMIRGEYTKAAKGGFVGLPPVFGYRYVWNEETTPKGHRFVADLAIDDAEAAVVRLIHDLFPSMLFRQIAVHLNDLASRGDVMYFPNKYADARQRHGSDHRPWGEDRIRAIIHNDLYIGRLQYAVEAKSAYLRGLDPVYVYRDDLRILPDDVWDRNQRIVELRRRIPSETKASPHLFSGILRCPHCDAVMGGRTKLHPRNRTNIITYDYTCSAYNRFGPSVCPNHLLPERCAVEAVLPVLTQLIQANLRDHLAQAASPNHLNQRLQGELRAELAKVNQAMKNLLEAVKAGALSFDQIREENSELQATKQRLEKRLADLGDATRITDDLRAILAVFDTDLEAVLADLMTDHLRFNTFIRIFFAELVIERDRPGAGWRKGKKKGELPPCNARISKFTLEPKFELFVRDSGLTLPRELSDLLTSHQPSHENLSESQGSPCRL